jgi:hypothetical protein
MQLVAFQNSWLWGWAKKRLGHLAWIKIDFDGSYLEWRYDDIHLFLHTCIFYDHTIALSLIVLAIPRVALYTEK